MCTAVGTQWTTPTNGIINIIIVPLGLEGAKLPLYKVEF